MFIDRRYVTMPGSNSYLVVPFCLAPLFLTIALLFSASQTRSQPFKKMGKRLIETGMARNEGMIEPEGGE